jgi:hypothetical protein
MNRPCERVMLYRPATIAPLNGECPAAAVPWCNTHQQEMLTGLRCATGWDEEIAELRTEVTEMKLRLNRAHR